MDKSLYAFDLDDVPSYWCEHRISSEIRKHCLETGVPVDPVEAQKVLDYIGSEPTFIYDTTLHTTYGTVFRGPHALITFVEGLYGVHIDDAKATAECVGLSITTERERGRELILCEGNITVTLDRDGCVDGIVSYG